MVRSSDGEAEVHAEPVDVGLDGKAEVHAGPVEVRPDGAAEVHAERSTSARTRTAEPPAL